MSERERLIELIEAGTRLAYDRSLEDVRRIVKEKHHFNSATDRTVSISEMVADYLLENGVIVPIVKEGDTRYAVAYAADTRVIEVRITEIDRDGSVIRVESVANPLHFWFLSAKVFYEWANFKTREEAEKALKESDEK